MPGAGLLRRGVGLLRRGSGLLGRGAGLLRRGASLLGRGAGLLCRGAGHLGLSWCWQNEAFPDVTLCHNDNRDLFYVVALVLRQLLGKVDPRRWH